MNLKTLAIFLTFTFSAIKAFATPTEVLIFDTKEPRDDGLPRNFRDLSTIGLNAIASGEFSEAELQAVRKKYPTEKIIIVDLRRENHGLINGQAVSWRTKFDLGNSGKKPSDLVFEENKRLNKIERSKTATVRLVIEKEKDSGWYKETKAMPVVVTSAMTEKKLAQKYGFEYKRFSVRDRAAPDDRELLNMITFIRGLEHDQRIYVHCAAGKGRTTTFLTIFDIIKNGKTTDLETILKRQSSLGGARLDVIDDKEEWRIKLAQERLKLIREFYTKETGKKASTKN